MITSTCHKETLDWKTPSFGKIKKKKNKARSNWTTQLSRNLENYSFLIRHLVSKSHNFSAEK
jgi:hypothetical protein